MESKEFKVYFQPIYDIKTSALCGAEALARKEDVTQGLLAPASFIPAMEADGTIEQLDLLMFEETAELINKWRAAGLNTVSMAVNMSQVTLKNPALPKLINAVIQKFNLPSNVIEMEVTETMRCTDFPALQKTLSAIRDAGIRIVMDDFGAAYSNVIELTLLKADVLKLDKAFLLGGSEDENKTKKIIAHIAQMAKDIGMKVVAEGVETPEHFDFIKTTVCDSVQGFYFARPMTAENFTKLLEQRI